LFSIASGKISRKQLNRKIVIAIHVSRKGLYLQVVAVTETLLEPPLPICQRTELFGSQGADWQ
jgi:hypothetical protein